MRTFALVSLIFASSAQLALVEAKAEGGSCSLPTPDSDYAKSPKFPPDVGTKKIHEDEASVVWDMVVEPGERLPPHEHVYDYNFFVIEGSRLSVFSGSDASFQFSFDSPKGASMAFKRVGDKMHDITGKLPPFDAIHGVQNIGNTTYREILIENKPCASRNPSSDKKRIFLAKSAEELTSFLSTGGVDVDMMISGSQVNHESETDFAKEYSHAAVVSNPGDDVVLHSQGEEFLEFEFRPVGIKAEPEKLKNSGIKHMVFIKFKVDAPVGDLIAGYAALPSKISQMQGFEYGPVNNQLGYEENAQGLQYVFVTSFGDSEDRDAYLVHDAHTEYVEVLFPHIDDFVIVDMKIS
mmetsp:Transcript_25503/g.45316  ORF Transcript_25503/g.45316 Transcript_25503/m.45316 type:complete len:351 (-) Transcript_25503:42-1094(-)